VTKSESSVRSIKSEILFRIREGIWPPGELIPGEKELAEELSASKSAVSRVLRDLAGIGVLERRRKAGTRVVSEPIREARLDVPIVRADIERRGCVYRYCLLYRNLSNPPESICAKLGLPVESKALNIRCLHFSDGVPHQYENRWINLAAVPAARSQSFKEVAPNEWLVKEIPLSNSEHIFSAENSNATESDLLGIRENDAIFVIERRTWLGDKVITVTRMAYPGASYKMSSKPMSTLKDAMAIIAER
jgi:GntR family histidine utilization transcriptional repressor